jgi:hypothetical protein
VRLARLVIAVALVAASACSKQDEPAREQPPLPTIADVEVKRALDACEDYVARACKCSETVPAAAEPCTLAKLLPESIEVAKRLANNPKAAREDALQAANSIRKTVKQCVEQTAKLPALGCP